MIGPPPPFNDDLRLAQRREDFSVVQFVPEPAINALAVAILPGTARLDEQRRTASRRYRARRAEAIHSGPLSERICVRQSRVRNSSPSTSWTSLALIRRRTPCSFCECSLQRPTQKYLHKDRSGKAHSFQRALLCILKFFVN